MSEKSKLPEDIDQLENFYKQKFDSHEVPVSDDLWEKISNRLDSMPVQPTQVSSHFLKSTKIWIVGGGIVASSAIFMYGTKVFDKESTKIDLKVEKQQEIVNPVESPKEVLESKVIVKNTASAKNARISDGNTTPKEQEQQVKEVNTSEIVESENPLNVQESKTEETVSETKSEPISEPVIEKETKLNFFEKTAKTKKDSTRKLFVPREK